MVFSENGNAFDCFDYTPDALIRKAAELRGFITVETMVPLLSFTSSLAVEHPEAHDD
jgi:hypothetical protein